ncbi:hypothetical protein PLICRDRAFT_45539 [Plicaturopsis crispa FD-325 SS-3]|uniref:Unplaced genomic scaffold PLICRscaffold_16, whole genome shotgun sequence n=1 Tax=Plicaturopsis crispa FD-325 SS-3 TaxID=944288 RepID=A0A0C9SRK1_PLICR|nr:hypothetical protein PLICRDRAFT_45539 [Plicaturopsis crispa FD-325 SS-3]
MLFSRAPPRLPPPRPRTALEESFKRLGIKPTKTPGWHLWPKILLYWIRRYSWAISRRIWSLTGQRWLYLKECHGDADAEAASIRYVRRHTTIPVPRVWGPFNWLGTRFIVMSRVPGHSFDIHEWTRMPRATQDSIIAQLRYFVSQLRALPPPPSSTTICSVIGGPVHDSRIEFHPVGPFADEDEMNWYVRQGMPMEWLKERSPACYESHNRRHPLVLTHGDIAPRNIMIEGSTITAIIDWENCGWYPEHWEYRKAHWASDDITPGGWNDRIREFVEPFDFELEADRTIAPPGSAIGFPEGTQTRYRSVVVDIKDGLAFMLEKQWTAY